MDNLGGVWAVSGDSREGNGLIGSAVLWEVLIGCGERACGKSQDNC